MQPITAIATPAEQEQRKRECRVLANASVSHLTSAADCAARRQSRTQPCWLQYLLSAGFAHVTWAIDIAAHEVDITTTTEHVVLFAACSYVDTNPARMAETGKLCR
jgi:hypothetical protein